MNVLLKNLVVLFLVSFSLNSFAEDSYKVIDPAQPTQVAEGKIEVVEIFWYGCPHCYDFEPHIEPWLDTIPEDVQFRRMPGIFSEKWIPHARAFYAAQELGVLDKVHVPLFEAMHKQKRPLNDKNSLKKFFAEQGIDEDAFSEAYDSEAVNNHVKKAFMAGRRYQVRGVPSLIVEGKYLISASSAGSYENMLKVTNQLVDKHRE